MIQSFDITKTAILSFSSCGVKLTPHMQTIYVGLEQ